MLEDNALRKEMFIQKEIQKSFNFVLKKIQLNLYQGEEHE